MMVRNSTAYPKMFQKKALVARAVAATAVPETPPEMGVWEGEDGPQDSHSPNLTTRQRQGKLLEELDLGILNSWPLELQKMPTGCWLSIMMFSHWSQQSWAALTLLSIPLG